MTNEEMVAKIAELTRTVEELTERVGATTGVLMEVLYEREMEAMSKAFMSLKKPREKAVDIIGFTVRPWMKIALPTGAKSLRALPLDSAIAALMVTMGQEDQSDEMAGMVREFSITWDEIGVEPDGAVRPDSMAKLFKPPSSR